jgi:hypothetical protein
VFCLAPRRRETRAYAFFKAFCRDVDRAASSAPAAFLADVRALAERTAAAARDGDASRAALRGRRRSAQCEFRDAAAKERADAAREWSRYFQSVTMDRGPWQACVPPGRRREFHRARDFTLCADGVALRPQSSATPARPSLRRSAEGRPRERNIDRCAPSGSSSSPARS